MFQFVVAGLGSSPGDSQGLPTPLRVTKSRGAQVRMLHVENGIRGGGRWHDRRARGSGGLGLCSDPDILHPRPTFDDALTRFGASTGFQLLYDASLALGRRSTAVEGVMEPRQALMRLLDGTGLSARFTSRGAVVIYATSASTAVALKPITAVAAPLVGRRGRRGRCAPMRTEPGCMSAEAVEARPGVDPKRRRGAVATPRGRGRARQ